MDRLEKKCLIASAGTHLFLFLILLFGAAFLVSPDKTVTQPTLKAVPTKLIDAALSGGGGNPKLAPSDAQQKGATLVPQPVQPPPQQRTAQQPPPKPEVTKPEPKHEIKKVDKPKIVKPAKDPVKPTPEPEVKTAKADQIILTPITRHTKDKAKEKAEAEAKEAAAAAAAASKKAAREIARAAEALRSGFSHGTLVDIPPGPGGEAYADYAQFVKSVYEDAWIVTDDLTDEDSTAKVSVTIARSGRVISARIERASHDSALDKSVQRALDKVRFVAPFPENARDEQRTFLINFNLKAKHLLG